jgi:drug/metabolite transporter (DMT)-like permease
MSLGLAYLSVILVWASTPLAIHWSNTDFDFISSICGRIVIAAAVGFCILKLIGQRLVHNRSDWLNFAVGSIGLFPTMLLVYWAAKTVPSGLMSVIFGLFPFMVGLGSVVLLKQNIFTPIKSFALVLALLGLGLINWQQLSMGWNGIFGVGAIVIATLCWALSSVLLKNLPSIDPFRQSVGSMIVASPGFLIAWVLFAEPIPEVVSLRSIGGMAYLIIAGSLLGHTLFFYVLKHGSVVTVSLIPLITPVLALLLGWLIEGEVLSKLGLLGAVTVLVALAIFQGAIPRLLRAWAILAPVSGSK